MLLLGADATGRTPLDGLFMSASRLYQQLQSTKAEIFVCDDKNKENIPPPNRRWADYTDDEDEAFPVATRATEKEKKTPVGGCRACGGPHWVKDCMYTSHRCEKCRRLGHKEENCPSTVIRSPDGRVELLLTQRPGGAQLTTYKDRTQGDRLKSAHSVIQELLDQSRARLDRDKVKRQENKSFKRKKPTPTPSSEAVPAEISDSEEGEEEEGCDDGEGVAWTVEADRVEAFSGEVLSGAPRLCTFVNRLRTRVVIDTGANCDFCGLEFAKEHSLVLTDEYRRVHGVGSAYARVAEPVPVHCYPFTASASFLVFEERDTLPAVIGRPTQDALGGTGRLISCCEFQESLGKLGVLDVEEKGIVEPEEGESVYVYPADGLTEDVVRRLISTTLPRSQRDDLLEVLTEFRDIWENVDSPGVFQCCEAQLETVGRPCKAKQRTMTEELRKECGRQIDDLLEKGLIEPVTLSGPRCRFLKRRKMGSTEWLSITATSTNSWSMTSILCLIYGVFYVLQLRANISSPSTSYRGSGTFPSFAEVAM